MNMKIQVAFKDGLKQVVQSDSGYEVVLDAPVESGGEASGFRPMELVLAGLGGCVNVEVLAVLRKMRYEVTTCRVLLTAQRHKEHPKVFTNIHLDFSIQVQRSQKPLVVKRIQRHIQTILDKYCSVAAMLEKTACLTFNVVVQDV